MPQYEKSSGIRVPKAQEEWILSWIPV